MRESLDITLFNAGIISNPDIQDIPDNAASDSNNVDGDLYEGKLGGIPTASLYSATLGIDARISAWITLADGTFYLVYCNAYEQNLKAIKDFYGFTPTASSLSLTNKRITDMITYNQVVYTAGLSAYSSNLWIGKPEWGQFGGSAPTDLISTDAKIPIHQDLSGDFYISNGVRNAGILAFTVDNRYEYTLSAVYDGLQESPLYIGGILSMTALADTASITVTITCRDGALTPANINKRLTAIKLYRRERYLSTTGDTTLYQHLQTFDVTKAIAYGSTTWDTSGNNKIVTYVDNNTNLGATYEAITGIPETLTETYVPHELHAQSGGYLFIAKCTITDIPDASHMVFRSKEYRFSMFNWINDTLRLPTIPTAMAEFEGRLFIFSENHIYRVTLDLELEDTTEGIGCINQRSLVVTDYGMFWCDRSNAYWHDGKNIIPIGDAIKSTDTTKDWHGFTFDYGGGWSIFAPAVTYNSKKHYVIFGVSNISGNISNVWAWHVVKHRWDKWLNFSNANINWGMFTGKDGESYVADGTNLYKCFGGTTRRAWNWISKEFDFDDPSQLKQFYKFFYDQREGSSTTPVYTYGINGAAPTTALVSNEFKSGGAFINAKTMKIKIVESGLSWVVYSISLLFRKFIGKR